MGFAGIAAGVGAAATLAGAGISYSAASHSAAAAEAAQQQELTSQNTAFQSRIAAQNQETQEQAAIQDKSQASYLAAEQQMRQQQSQALSDQQTAVNKMNQQEQQIQDQTTQQVQQTTQAITPQSLQQAQEVSAQERMQPVQQTAADIGASNPLSSSGEGSATKSALAKAMSDAAEYTQGYGERAATLGSYSAPMQAVDLAASNLKTNLLPAATADTLLKAGVNARLLPYTTAYSGAGTLGQAAIDANTQNTSEQMSLASTKAQYAEDLADLGQTDTNAIIQTGLNVTQARDAATASLGKGIEGLGTAAIGFGASQGAFSGLFGTGTGTGALSGTAGYVSGVTGSSLGGLGAPAIGTETITPYWTGLMKGASAFS